MEIYHYLQSLDISSEVITPEDLSNQIAVEFNKNINEKTAYISIIIGLIGGFLMFPSPDFSKSLLVGILMPKELFGPFVAQSLLFLSFVIATFLPLVVFKAKKF